MKNVPLKQLNKEELELWDILIGKAKLYAAQGKRDTVYSEGWDRGASWAFAHSANVIYEQSKELSANANRQELIALRWMELKKTIQALLKATFVIFW